MSCKFRKDWLGKKEYKDWIQEVHDSPSKAYCHACKKTIDLSNMGQGALTSHMKGKKHQEVISVKSGATSQQSIEAFCSTSDQPDTVPSTSSQDTEHSENVNAPQPSARDNTTITQYYATSTDIKKAEIIWALKSVMAHFSYNASSDIGDVLRAMFTDSDIAKKFKCGSTKLAYLVCFGIAPYFTEQLINKVRKAVCYVISFDESLNPICQEGQMDVIVRYFYRDKVVSQYLQSQFLGHASAQDLVSAFKQGTSKLNPSKMLQVSMDGPNVNFKFLSDLQDDRKKEDPDLPGILQLGSCSLHIVHGAFSTGIQKTGWNLESLLRAIWYLFKDSPARRSDFKKITKTNVFGLKFCSTRWVEDICVVERAIKIWPHLVTYVKETLKKPKRQIPTVASFKTLQEFVVSDKLILAKLEVFLATAKLVQPFLKKYQTEKPMMPFITEDLCNILRSLMTRFIKGSVLTEAKTSYKLASIDVNDQSSWLSLDKVDPGFAANRLLDQALKSKVASPLAKSQFLTACLHLYCAMTHKILERCPLKYSMVRALQALDPRFMIRHQQSAEEKMKTVLSKLVDSKWKQDRECEIMRQFRELLGLLQREFRMECENFSVDSERLDSFFHSVVGLPLKPELKELWEVIQHLLTLSHGQAAVERGFSINSDLLAPNLKTESVVAQRMVYDTVALSGLPVADFEITPGLLRSCNYAYSRYTTHLSEQKEERQKQNKLQKRAAEETELNEERKKLKKLEHTLVSLTTDADKHAMEAEKKNNFTLLAKSNALRQKAKQMEGDIKKQKDVVSKLSASLQKV